ncbi:MAG: hypothetical protein IJ449_13085 [Clostridia bacterium]|nr:hypothetical protein [Clostridia bacterium]
MKLLILGNSITHHAPAPGIGWHGDWGMAASTRETDFVHRLAARLGEAGKHVVLRERNVADFERDPALIDSTAGTGDAGADYFREDLAFRPDIAVLRISENVPGEKTEAFTAAYEKLLGRFAAQGAAVFAVGPFWQNDRMEALLSAAAERTGAVWVSLSHLHKTAYQAVGQFEHAGVAAHPSDEGMQAIADAIFSAVSKAGLLTPADVPDIPAGAPVYDKLSVTVDGKPVPLHAARVSAMSFNREWPGQQRPVEQSELAPFLTFDMSAPVDIAVTAETEIHDITVRPRSAEISVETDENGKTAYFTVRRPGQYSVEVNGRHHNLHIFANAPAKPVDPSDYTHYFAPGIHEVGNLRLHSGDRVYLAAGAVVYGAIQAYDETDIRIEGRGILDYSKMERHVPLHWEEDGIVNLVRCENVTIDGIILRDASWWTITSFNCINLHFRNLKAIGMWRYNSDGFDFVNCQNVRVDGCFLRNFDDVIVFKGLRLREMSDGYKNQKALPPYEHMNLQNFIIENCVLWCDWGGALEIGAETVADEYTNLVYRNCDIIHSDQGAMRIQSGDRAVIHNVLYDNIRVEYSKYDRAPVYQQSDDMVYAPADTPWMCDVIKGWMYCGRWSNDGIYGNVYDITYRDIAVYADEGMPNPVVSFTGADETHTFDRIRIENMTYNGAPVMPQVNTNAFTGRITINGEEKCV